MTTDSVKILAVSAELLSDFYEHTEFCAEPARVRGAMDVVCGHGRSYLREWAEETESIRQVRPCVIVRNGARLLCVKRAKKGGEDLRLRSPYARQNFGTPQSAFAAQLPRALMTW